MYEKLYHHLFNAITDALRALEEGNAWEMKKILIEAQCKAEDIYISYGDNEDVDKVVEIFVENVENP